MALDKRLLKQLKDKDPKVRRKAIVALADSRDLAALEPLEQAARDDPEQKLRDLAVRAQNHLKEQMARKQQAADAPEASADGYAPAPKISEREVARARSYMDEALSYYIAKDLSKATASLSKALRANPGLKNESYFLSLAGDVLNADPDEAIKILLDSSRRGEFVNISRKSQKQKKKDEHYGKTDELSWAAVFFDLGIFAVVTAVITFLTPLVFVQMINQTVAYEMGLSPEQMEQASLLLPPEIVSFNQAVSTFGVPIFLIVALVSAVATAISMLIQGGAIHLVATKLLGGVGTMRFMMCQILPFYSMTSLVLFVWWCIAMGMLAIGAGIIGALCMAPMSLAGLYILFKVAGKIGAAYDFGSAKGCLSLVLASLLLSLISALPGILAYNYISSQLMEAMMTGL